MENNNVSVILEYLRNLGDNVNEDLDETENLTDIDTSKIAQIIIPNRLMKEVLGLPDDVKITSIHTKRGEDSTGIYMICNRFESVTFGNTSPELTVEEVRNIGLWDPQDN